MCEKWGKVQHVDKHARSDFVLQTTAKTSVNISYLQKSIKQFYE